MVALVPKSKRDKRHTLYQSPEKNNSSGFAGELDKAMEVFNPDDFQTLTYNSKSQLEPFIYVRHKFSVHLYNPPKFSLLVKKLTFPPLHFSIYMLYYKVEQDVNIFLHPMNYSVIKKS